jgi:hypothetical protein
MVGTTIITCCAPNKSMLTFNRERLPCLIGVMLFGVVLVGGILIASSQHPNDQVPITVDQQTAVNDPRSQSVFVGIGSWIMDRRGGFEVGADLAIAIFTGLIFIVTVGQFFAFKRADRHFQVTERAYVKVSHQTPNEGFALSFNPAGVPAFYFPGGFSRTESVAQIERGVGHTPCWLCRVH